MDTIGENELFVIRLSFREFASTCSCTVKLFFCKYILLIFPNENQIYDLYISSTSGQFEHYCIKFKLSFHTLIQNFHEFALDALI